MPYTTKPLESSYAVYRNGAVIGAFLDKEDAEFFCAIANNYEYQPQGTSNDKRM